MSDGVYGQQSSAGESTLPTPNGQPLSLPFTGERIIPGKVGETLFSEHEARYIFAGQFVKNKRVLDVACGTGIGTSYLRKAGSEVCIGIDIDRSAIEYARATYRDCTFEEGDASSLPLPDRSVDVVVSFETVEHITNPAAFLTECKRVLRDGGFLICSTPNREMVRWNANNPYHTREFTVAEFTELFGGIFSDVRFYSQKNTNRLTYAARTLALRVVCQLNLKSLLMKVVGRSPDPIAARSEFQESDRPSGAEVRPYEPGEKWLRPLYFIAVGRKSGTDMRLNSL